jgi:hypothetical protein
LINRLLVGVFVIGIITVLFLSVQPTGQSQIEIIETSNIDFDQTCTINCEIDDPSPNPTVLSTQDITALPNSNDSILQQALDQAEIIPLFKVDISRQLGETITPISELELSESLSFITIENEFDDITGQSLSYIFEMENVEFGALIVQTLVNNKIKFTQEIDFTDNIVETNPRLLSDLLSDDGENIIELKITKLFVRADKPFFLPEPITISTITLDNQPNQILITEESGQSIKVYPTDDQLQIFATASDITYRKGQCQSSTGGSCYRYSYALATASPRPEMGAITVLDSIGNQVAFSQAVDENDSKQWVNYRETLLPTKLIDVELQRNSQYTVKIGSPNNVEFIIDTPKSQQNFVYSCTIHGCDFP